MIVTGFISYFLFSLMLDIHLTETNDKEAQTFETINEIISFVLENNYIKQEK